MDNRINTQWFVDKLDAKRMSQRALARHLGLDSSAVSLTLRGKRDMKLMEAAEIAQLIGVPVDEVLHHAGVQGVTRGKRISVAKVLGAHGEVQCLDRGEAFDVAAPADTAGDDWIACQARTSGSDLEHMDGWLFFMRQPHAISNKCLGRFCVAQLKNGVMVMATVKKGYQPNRYNLTGPFASNDVELEWAQPIEHIKT